MARSSTTTRTGARAMVLSGSTYPCARCFKTTQSVIDGEKYDKDETPARVGVKITRDDGSHEIVCAGCLRNDYAEKVSPAKKIISGPATSTLRAALRNDEDDDDAPHDADDAGNDTDDVEDEAPIKPLPKPSGLILSSKPDETTKKKKKWKKKHTLSSRIESESEKKTIKIKKRKNTEADDQDDA